MSKLTKEQMNKLGGIFDSASSAIGVGLQNAQIKDTSSEEALINDFKNTEFSGSLDNLASSFDSNNLLGTNYTADDLRGLSVGQSSINTAMATLKGIGSGFTKGGVIGAAVEGGINLFSGIGGTVAGGIRAQKKADELNSKASNANNIYLNNFAGAVNNTQNKMFNASAINIKSYGGPLFDFTGNFDNGLVFINEGGKHETNPLGGIQIGIDNEGVPNLVEEGEVIYNDYVFSNRLKPTDKQILKSGLNKKYKGWTFAKIVEDIQKESANNPIDFISQNTLKDMMGIIMNLQEETRMKKNKQVANVFKEGGPFSSKAEELEADRMQAAEDALMDHYEGLLANKLRLEKGLDLNLGNGIATEEEEDENNQLTGLLRYASPFINAGTFLNNLKKPDYSNAERIEKAAQNITKADYTPLGNYLNLKEIDPNTLVNPILANAAANRRAIQNQGLTAGQAIYGILAANNATNKAVGDAKLQAIQANNTLKAQEAQFNRGTDQANAQMGLQVAGMNQARDRYILGAIQTGANMRENIDAQRSTALSQSLTGLGTDLANIGREQIDRDMLNKLIEKGVYLNMSKNGGMLTIRKRK